MKPAPPAGAPLLLCDPAVAPPLPLRRAAALHAMALAPVPVVALVLYWAHSILLAVAAFDTLCLCLLPLLYLLTRPRGDPRDLPAYRRLVSRLTAGWARHLPCAVGLGSAAAFAALASYVAVSWAFPGAINRRGVSAELEHDGMPAPDAPAVTLAVYFTLINPVLEELFWRVLVQEELRAAWRGCGSSEPVAGDCDPEAQEPLLDPAAPAPHQSPRRDMRSLSPEAARVLGSFYYASYHSIVVVNFVNLPWAILALGGLTAAGRLLTAIREHCPAGLFYGTAVHMGLDLGVVLVVSDILYAWA
eukprot:TRINITY_DN64890_c0_g1_i1.p2 TRINITY_DN64890_c0_g1~~TRINITY_DN64890_c0_g1_i1.p2  ORF type:complete len:329 (+),score=102.87 TRINITY_DN64890_c0_g1_i1:81-989(+)